MAGRAWWSGHAADTHGVDVAAAGRGIFTVVHYDQRGAGRSFRLSNPDEVRSTMHPAQYTRDAVDLVEWLRGELGVDRVVIAGHSWGAVIATRAALDRPDLFSAL